MASGASSGLRKQSRGIGTGSRAVNGTSDIPALIPVHDPRHYRVRVRARANYQEDNEEEGLEVEERRLV